VGVNILLKITLKDCSSNKVVDDCMEGIVVVLM